MSGTTDSLVSPRSLGRLAWLLVRSIGVTLSIEWVFEEGALPPEEGKQFVYVLWHGRMFIPLYCMKRTRATMLVSEHRDGEIITTTLHAAGYRTIRGSTTRGGIRALARLVREAKQGRITGFTVDGPRGPRWRFQPGALFVAAKTGVPIVPVGASARRSLYFKSWDSFQLPLPFSRAAIILGKPYTVDGGSDPGNIERHRRELERILIDLNRRADELIGAPVGR